jgi:hypothetical protein
MSIRIHDVSLSWSNLNMINYLNLGIVPSLFLSGPGSHREKRAVFWNYGPGLYWPGHLVYVDLWALLDRERKGRIELRNEPLGPGARWGADWSHWYYMLEARVTLTNQDSKGMLKGVSFSFPSTVALKIKHIDSIPLYAVNRAGQIDRLWACWWKWWVLFKELIVV